MNSESAVSFSERLNTGLVGEGDVARWFIGKGYQVLPAYQVELSTGKGPRLFTGQGQLISPDMLIFKGDKVRWIEAKTKSAFTWHRITRTWVTGIDRRHWKDYLEVERITPFPVWILFLHRSGNFAKDTPEGFESPCGLFGNEIAHLKNHIHHESDKWGRSGMVYWDLSSLRRLQ